MTDLFNSGIRPALDDWLLAKSKEERDYGNFWSASSAGYCQRKVIFERLQIPHVETEADARKQRIFTSGHLFHEWIQGITKETGLSIAQELELQDEELMIRGHIDDLVLVGAKDEWAKVVPGGIRITDPPAQHLILYDYKTVNSQSFKYKHDLSHYHRMQLGTYMYMLRNGCAQIGNLLKEDLDKHDLYATLTEARILLISKDDLRMKEQQLLWDTELESGVLEWWNSLNDHWNNKTLPKCTCEAHESGFMASEKWNPFFFDGKPCSLEWAKKHPEQLKKWKDAK